MKDMINKHGMATIGRPIEPARESGVKLIARQMTMDVTGVKQSDIIGIVASWLDAA